MTLTLVLTRHAKSDWGDPGLDDHDRPLNKRGRRDAPRIGNHLRALNAMPNAALCSTALRARQTLEAIAPDIPADFISDLYLASPMLMTSVLRKAAPQNHVMVAHNPGIGRLAHELVKTSPEHDRFLDYPTGATLVVAFDIDTWTDIQLGTGEVIAFFTPHDLTDA